MHLLTETNLYHAIQKYWLCFVPASPRLRYKIHYRLRKQLKTVAKIKNKLMMKGSHACMTNCEQINYVPLRSEVKKKKRN